MRYISVFSGIEAASVAWQPLGWEPVCFSEIEPFPSAVLAERFPEVPNLGDITKVDWSTYAGTVDIVVGGSPCQSFSVAGKREGLAGASGLMFEYIRAVRELRPRFFVWENVPGALSSEDGAAFGQLLSEMDDLGYGVAWRVLDAQFFGVAQRRRRVFLVGHLGDERSGEVLFESESLRWDTPSSREKREVLTRGAQNGVGEASEPRLNHHTWEIAGNIIGRQEKNGGHQLGIVDPDKTGAFTLTTADRHAIADCLTPWDNQGRRLYRPDGVYPTLDARTGNAGADARAVMTNYGRDIAGTLALNNDQTLFPPTGSIRRLTPIECERLQGFPDGWTDIPWRGKDSAPDGPRYKALGNSMAVPVMRWIGGRIANASETHVESQRATITTNDE